MSDPTPPTDPQTEPSVTPESVPAADAAPTPSAEEQHTMDIINVVQYQLSNATYELGFDTAEGKPRIERMVADMFLLREWLRRSELPDDKPVKLTNYTGHEKLGTLCVDATIGELRALLPQVAIPLQEHLSYVLRELERGRRGAGLRLSLIVASYECDDPKLNFGLFIQAKGPDPRLLKQLDPARVQKFLDSILETHKQLTAELGKTVPQVAAAPEIVIAR